MRRESVECRVGRILKKKITQASISWQQNEVVQWRYDGDLSRLNYFHGYFRFFVWKHPYFSPNPNHETEWEGRKPDGCNWSPIHYENNFKASFVDISTVISNQHMSFMVFQEIRDTHYHQTHTYTPLQTHKCVCVFQMQCPSHKLQCYYYGVTCS